ncbi:G-protein coupled receptor Mth2 isoform X1 [Papilio machaon]|uniref:G-protein coupled receptor Mth2 isoform X1 n=1 Tax=Papilio machaon TaxID=76193 RepID=UPI001E662A39|nr:G-protein coupled receptor Mth2 isoform X1 [Papilio machaon]
MLISCVFIIATVGVYAWLPELRNMHGRVLMAYLLCLFCGFLCMSSLQIMLTVDNISSDTCLILTIIIYYFLESAFFWLNVMSFDIWWTFSGKGGMGMSKVSKRFCIYSLYAFGVPTILTIILASLEFSGLPPHPLLPMLRDQGCFIFGRSKLLYLYGPMFILFVANIIFFVMTALKIAHIKQQTAVLNSKESAMHDHHRKDKQRLLLYLKLFTVMGINWILEVISALYPDADYIWMFTDAYNLLIGVTIFIIFVCKRKIFHLIKKRFVPETKGKLSRSDGNCQEFSYRTTIPIRIYKNNQTQKGSMETIKTVIDDDNNTANEVKNTKL